MRSFFLSRWIRSLLRPRVKTIVKKPLRNLRLEELEDRLAPATLTVTPATLTMIMVSPTNPSLTQGQTEQFMAMGMYSDNSSQDLTTQVTWVSSNTAVATISRMLRSG